MTTEQGLIGAYTTPVIDGYFVNRIPEILLQKNNRHKVNNPRVIPTIDSTTRTLTHLDIARDATIEDISQVIRSYGLTCNGLIGGERNTGPNAKYIQRFWLDPCDDPKLPGFWELNHAGD